MIFSVSNHVQQIISGEKTQTRRDSNYYKVGRSYAIQSGRNKPGIPEGRVLITDKRVETIPFISVEDAKAEGGYSPAEFEILYRRMYPKWPTRYAYTFKFIPTEKPTKLEAMEVELAAMNENWEEVENKLEAIKKHAYEFGSVTYDELTKILEAEG